MAIPKYLSLKNYISKSKETDIFEKVTEEFQKEFKGQKIDLSEIEYQKIISTILPKIVGVEVD